MVLWGENRPEWIAAFWGCLLNGVVVVPVDYRTSTALLDRIAELVQARAVVAGAQVAANPGHWRMNDLQWAVVQDCATFSKTPFAQLCEILFTSGATADPKGVTITHANLLANIVPVETEILKYRKWSVPFAPIRFLNLLPLSHLFGQSMATFIPPILRGEVVFMSSLAPREIALQIRTRRISVLVAVPQILEVLREFVIRLIPEAGEPARPGANWVRRWWQYRRVHNLFGWKFWSFIVGAAPLEPALEEFWSKLGFVVVQGYGLTETAPIVTLNHPFHTSKGSVGKPIGGVEVKIAEDGEILVRGANVTAGYFGAAAGEDDAFADGWFHTGDVGSRDAEGGVFIRGRKKEMIVTPDGLNVFPEDVERVLNGMAGVKESAVVGTDRVHAVLVLEPGANAESVVALANEKLEPYQRIREATVWPHEQLPRTEGTQKLKRTAIRAMVEGGAAAPSNTHGDAEELLGSYADETPLEQVGLSSLDRVELMVRSERAGAGSISEEAFTEARTVGELRRLARTGAVRATPEIAFPSWNQSRWVRATRRVALSAVLLPLLRIFVWLRVRGRENLPPDARVPVLFAVNHQSVFDVPTVLAALPGRWRYRVATAMGMDWFGPHFHPENYGWGTRFGNHLQYYLVTLFFNAFPIPQHEAGAREALRYAGDLVSDGISVLLFPEGVRTQAGEIAPFRPGVGMMAARLRLRVVPVRIEGLERVLHQSWKWPRPGRVTVTFGKAMDVDGADYAGAARGVEEAVRGLDGEQRV